MSAIAEEADTAVQTIYDSAGPKRAIILALVNVTEEEAGVEEFQQRLRRHGGKQTGTTAAAPGTWLTCWRVSTR